MTTSYYDTIHVAESNEINCEIQDLLYSAAEMAREYDEFIEIGDNLKMAGAKLSVSRSSTMDTGFGSYEYEKNMVDSLANCAISLTEAQKQLNTFAR